MSATSRSGTARSWRADLVLARGFLSSLTAEGRRAALANLAGALEPGGVLLLGSEDSIGEGDLGLSPIRWGDRFAYEAAGPDPRPATRSDPRVVPIRDPDEAPDPELALVAHRSALVRGWIRILLEQRGLVVEEAPHGVRALELAAIGRPPSFFFLERTLHPRGGSWVLERLPRLGIATPEAAVYLSPGEADAPGGTPSAGLPLTRRDLDQVLAPPAP